VKDGWAEGWSEATARATSNIPSSRFAHNPLARHFAPRSFCSSQDLYFGYNDDEMLSTIKSLLPLDMAKTFSTYAPGLSNNYTSKEDVMRRDNIMVTYTGKDDITKLGKFKYYANMTHQYVCLDYTAVCDWVQVQEFDLDGGEIPVCYKFQADWNETEIACHGYSLMFQGEEANVIDGTDASQTGEIPFDEDYFQVFISDLYRSR